MWDRADRLDGANSDHTIVQTPHKELQWSVPRRIGVECV